MSLREMQKRNSRAHFLSIAAELFAERGYRGTTIDDIAAAAGASRATLYSYFPGKDAIVKAIVTQVWDAAEALYADFGALDEWSTDAIAGWLERVVRTWEQSGSGLRVQSSGAVPFDEFYLEYHGRFIAALTANSDLWSRFDDDEQQRRALLLISGLELFLNTWMVRGWPMDRAGAITTLTDSWCAILRVE
ncbi:tetr family transcriptional regulator [Gordonia neofelifaecis NRRL B-59395]|uniref:Tetr family transcriptional regulator n=1 Tax=Gordonia neofelifaecis NRRL B-59395 TaxID=644548 RepID=F1YN60_9ACTN|nr:tetr family transcriptional regulator [Gordonia neofelifaecis NRRL B-59395]